MMDGTYRIVIQSYLLDLVWSYCFGRAGGIFNIFNQQLTLIIIICIIQQVQRIRPSIQLQQPGDIKVNICLRASAINAGPQFRALKKYLAN